MGINFSVFFLYIQKGNRRQNNFIGFVTQLFKNHISLVKRGVLIAAAAAAAATTTTTTGTTTTTTATTTITTGTTTTTTCLFYPDDQGAVQVGKEALLRVHLGARAETQNLVSYSINQRWSL